MCFEHVNDGHFMMVNFFSMFLVYITSISERGVSNSFHDVGLWVPRYIHTMVRYNELGHFAGNEIIGDDDVVIIENLDQG